MTVRGLDWTVRHD